MKTAIKQAPVANLSESKINQLIAQAGAGASTMVNKTREAAMLAASELPAKGTAKARVDAVVLIHSKAFAKVDKNVKSLFVNLLTLAAEANTVVQIKPAIGKEGAVMMKAGEALKVVSKNVAQTIAKSIRDAEGTARAPKASKPAATPAGVSKPASFYDQLAAAMKDPEQVAKIRSVLEAAGYLLMAKASVKQAKSKASKLVEIPEVEVETLTAEETQHLGEHSLV